MAGTNTGQDTGGGPAPMAKVMGVVRDEFLKREFTVKGANGETEFTLAKMPATKGWDVLEEIRSASGSASNGPAGGGIEAEIKNLVAALPKEFARALRNTMFQYVTFRNRMAVSPMNLAGNEEVAFDAIEAEPLAIYEVFLRSLAVNFTPSFLELQDRISTFMSQTGLSLSTGNSPRS